MSNYNIQIKDSSNNFVYPMTGGFYSGVSYNNIKTTGLFYCADCTDGPTNVPWTAFALEVISVGSEAVKQILEPEAIDGYRFERHFINNTWSSWLEVGRVITLQKYDTSTIQYLRKPGDPNYGSFIIVGTAAGDGAVMIGVTINNKVISSTKNLMTNAAWSGGLTITYGLDNGIGWIGLKTTSNAGSNLAIICG